MPRRTMPVHIDVARADELPFSQSAAAAPIDAGRDERKRVRTPEAARALAQLPRRGRFVPRRIAVHPNFETHYRRRLEWLKHRRVELHNATGAVSAGVGAMLNAAAWSYAAGECASELAAAALDMELFRMAANLTTTARQHDLAAWEMAVREGQARGDDEGADLRRRQAEFQRQLADRQKGTP
jgi:hypothetical protein